MKILKGTILSFKKNPFLNNIEESVNIIEDGGILIKNGIIVEVDNFLTIKKKNSLAKTYDYGRHLITAGFIDCHMHYPQTGIISSFGKRLIDWLNDYTFPEEKKFIDPEYASKIASLTLNLCLQNGTTTVSSFCTSSPTSVNKFFEEANKREMCVVAGKTCMNRNAPDYLLDTVNSSYHESKKLIEKWHKNNRLVYTISPRFAPTSTPEQLECLGNLWSEFPDCLMQTHLSEQEEEIHWVKNLFPNAKNYLNVYEQFDLVRENSIFGHCIHLSDKELDILQERNSSVAHCPTSNLFIGSGIFNLKSFNKKKIKVGLATDTGGGTFFSMLKTMSETYKISQLSQFSIHPAQLLWLATMGSSNALNLQKEIGNIEKNYFADLNVIDLSSTQEIDQRKSRANNIWEAIFPTLIMGDDRAIKSTWVNGNEI